MILYRTIILAQGGEELDVCSSLFQGEQCDYMVGGDSQPVIDYLSQWDGYDWNDEDLTESEPRLSMNDTEYIDENGIYTLRYDNTLGGIFLLYREANKQEKQWYKENN